MLPLTVGMLVAGPTFGILSDRYGARAFATGGMIATALTFVGLWLLPINFSYPVFALVLLAMGFSMGLFASPNRAAVMNSLPPEDRGAGGAMNQTFQNSAQVLSVGIFFSLMIAGLATNLPHTLTSGLHAHGVPLATAHAIGKRRRSRSCSRRSSATTRSRASSAPTCWTSSRRTARRLLTGRSFFPQLISSPFRDGLHTAFTFAIIACLVAAGASALRGGVYHHTDAVDDAGPRRRR